MWNTWSVRLCARETLTCPGSRRCSHSPPGSRGWCWCRQHLQGCALCCKPRWEGECYQSHWRRTVECPHVRLWCPGWSRRASVAESGDPLERTGPDRTSPGRWSHSAFGKGSAGSPPCSSGSSHMGTCRSHGRTSERRKWGIWKNMKEEKENDWWIKKKSENKRS